jgi:hypothetical protein
VVKVRKIRTQRIFNTRIPMKNKTSSKIKIVGWMDGWNGRDGRDRISAREPQIGPNVHHTDEKLRETKDK